MKKTVIRIFLSIMIGAVSAVDAEKSPSETFLEGVVFGLNPLTLITIPLIMYNNQLSTLHKQSFFSGYAVMQYSNYRLWCVNYFYAYKYTQKQLTALQLSILPFCLSATLARDQGIAIGNEYIPGINDCSSSC